MRKVSICSGVWVLIILLLVASVTITIKDNVISSIRNDEQLRSINYHIVPISASFKAKGTADIFKNTRTIPKKDLKNTITQNPFTNYSIDDTYNNERNLLSHYDTSSKFPEAYDPEVPIDYLWKRRTLCTASDNEHHPIDTSSNNIEKTRTLLDYNGPDFMNIIEDLDSLKPHVRVKRTDPNLDFPISDQQNYLKDLADSFPRNWYESIDENYDDDTSFDAKREINSREYYANNRPKGASIRAIETEGIFDNEKTFDKLRESYMNDENQRKPSSLAIADLKADLLRFKRRARNDRREGSSKSKKKKKHASKKHDDSKGGSTRSRKNIRSKSTNRQRSVRERKNSETKDDDKSRARLSKLASATNNENNFRHRSVSPMKSVDNESKRDRESRDVLSTHTALKTIAGNNEDTGRFQLSLISHGRSFEASPESNDDLNTLTMKNGNSPPTRDESKIRLKRDRNAASKHGFFNKEDELQYYQNIQEFEKDKDCAAEDDDPTNYKAENNRAARSIEEVKDLAKRLVTKVDELENYLSFDEAEMAERGEKIETRAIDDLCSNVTSACADFKGTSEVVRRCIPTSTAKIMVNKKVGKSESKEHKRDKGSNGNLAVKKRSSKERVAKTIPGASKNVRRQSEKFSRKWGKWTDWSSCSVTCGKGRQIRWRYCLHDCTTAETEMEEKSCQLPACPPGKFLGIF
ncbi:uncharacterized protein LOC116424943 [Nomia melanderi]|uniref:uncharacterized protein LOC116424943 n=1 Tax=Nomia melanderi TaxID=2448451 RepID=UPI003FCD161D